MFKKNDLIFYLILFLIVILGIYQSFSRKNQNYLAEKIILQNDQEKIFLDSKKDSLYHFVSNFAHQKFKVQVQNREVRLLENYSPYQIGVKTGYINSKSGLDIICVPLKIIISFEKKNNKIDAITG